MLWTASSSIIVILAPFVGTALWRIAGKLLRSYFVARYTVLNELHNVGKARPDGERIRGTAVICGGSISGLWAARICADHFEDVLIVEPEAWLATEEACAPLYDEKGTRIEATPANARTRIYQYNAAHAFQMFVLNVLRHVFPNFDSELLKRGGRIEAPEYYSYTCSGRFFNFFEMDLPNRDSIKTFFCSRDAFERLLRSLVLGSSKSIRRLAGTVTGLLANDDDLSRIRAVSVNLGQGGNLEVPCALVVDCTGGTQAGLKWIKKLHASVLDGEDGLSGEAPTSSTVPSAFDKVVLSYNVHQRWKNYTFPVPPHIRDRLPIPGGYAACVWLYSFIPAPGLERKSFIIDKLDGHRIRYSFYGWGEPPIPESFDEIKEYLTSPLNAAEPVPQWVRDVTDILIESNREDDVLVASARLPPITRIKYENAPFVPSNFVAIGDSVMRINPTFGQGCTKACIGAITLDSALRSRVALHSREIPNNFGSQFFKTHRDKVADSWDGTKPMDYMFDTTTPIKGEALSDEKFNGSLSVLLLDMAVKDSEIDALLMQMRHFLVPPTDVFAPWVLWRVASFAMKRKLGWV